MEECFIRCGEYRKLKGRGDTSYVQHCRLPWPSGNRAYPLELGAQQRQVAAMPGRAQRSWGLPSRATLTSSVMVGTACNQDSWIVWVSGLRMWRERWGWKSALYRGISVRFGKQHREQGCILFKTLGNQAVEQQASVFEKLLSGSFRAVGVGCWQSFPITECGSFSSSTKSL